MKQVTEKSWAPSFIFGLLVWGNLGILLFVAQGPSKHALESIFCCSGAISPLVALLGTMLVAVEWKIRSTLRFVKVGLALNSLFLIGVCVFLAYVWEGAMGV